MKFRFDVILKDLKQFTLSLNPSTQISVIIVASMSTIHKFGGYNKSVIKLRLMRLSLLLHYKCVSS
jgi:hypothetical protein